MRLYRSTLAILLAFAAGCPADGTVPPADGPAREALLPDGGPDLTLDLPPDLTPDLMADVAVDDIAPSPDATPVPDLGPVPDASLCGNGQVDDPIETCDKAIGQGQEGACPTTADCDDGNICTADTLSGSVANCTAECVSTPIPDCCGNGAIEAAEECDDGNRVDTDGCSNQCQLPGGHLLLTEVATSPTEAEFIEIYNPTVSPVSLDDVYVSDRIDYFQLTTGSVSGTGASHDFIAGFPTGAVIDPGQHIVVAVQGGLSFKIAYGQAPDYELGATDATVPDMVEPVAGVVGSQSGLTDTGELVVLFTWDGASDLIQDIDYVVWKGSSATAIYKSSMICVDGVDADSQTTCYSDDTLVTAQSYLTPPQQGGSLLRCNYLEGAEVSAGGNGLAGHDETSEPLTGVGGTWKRNASTLDLRTPGAPAIAGFCP
jgi:cysteine-rich repeat protein